MRWRRTVLGVATILGLARRGFFIPYRYAQGVRPVEYPALEPLFREAEPSFREILAEIERLGPDLLRIGEGDGPARFDQTWFPALDAAAAYALVRQGCPRTIVEVGSGHSTRFLARAVQDGNLNTRIVCIDPEPRRPLDGLPVTHEAALLGQDHRPIFDTLAAGDILFIDSSHIAMPGTDVDRLFLDVLPRLPAGVLIHVHDIILPDAYPAAWTWRGYNEQLLVGALLQGGAYEIVFASHWTRTRLKEEVEKAIVGRLPLAGGAIETSLWLRKRRFVAG